MRNDNEDAERIRRQMQHVRQDMGDELKGIVLGARQLSDWRYYVKQHPWACLGAAFAVGFALMPGKRTPAQAEIDRLLAQLRSSTRTVNALGSAPGASGLLGRLVALAAPIVIRSATSFVSNQLSGARRPQSPPHDPVHTHGAFGDDQ
jgi:hypothetical protein